MKEVLILNLEIIMLFNYINVFIAPLDVILMFNCLYFCQIIKQLTKQLN